MMLLNAEKLGRSVKLGGKRRNVLHEKRSGNAACKKSMLTVATS
jgi:hypothetical protein